MAVKTVMAMVQVIHRMSAELTGTLIKVQTYGSMTQHNGLTLMEMDMVTMERLEQPILIPSRTTTLLPKITTQMITPTGGQTYGMKQTGQGTTMAMASLTQRIIVGIVTCPTRLV